MNRFRTDRVRVAPRKVMLGLSATIASLVLLPCAVAAADTITSNFEPRGFTMGSVNGQPAADPTDMRWRVGPTGAQTSSNPDVGVGFFDQAVVLNGAMIPGFGDQSLRLSNAGASENQFNQPTSPRLAKPASENGPNTEFIGKFSFFLAHYEPGLRVSVSPDSGTGSRMSYVLLTSTAEGTEVGLWDTEGNGEFNQFDVALLPDGVPHTIEFWIKLHPGPAIGSSDPNNDLMRLEIDGQDAGECFTTWEGYYRHSSVGNPTPRVPPDIAAMQFRPVRPTDMALEGEGFLFDNVSITSDNGTGPPGCDDMIEKQASTKMVHPGSLVHYTITARNRGRVVDRDRLVCDRMPREETFVHADRKLLRVGRQRCLVINKLAPHRQVTFDLTARVNRNAPAGRIDNGTDEIPGVEPPEPPLAPSPTPKPTPPATKPPATVPDVPGHVTLPRPEPGGGVTVDVVRRPERPSPGRPRRPAPPAPPPPRPAPPPPRVTG